MNTNGFFNPYNDFFQSLSRLVDLVGLSILWLICALPLVTIGPATSALYVAVLRCVRQEEGNPYRRFFQSLVVNLKPGILASLVFVPGVLLFRLGFPVLHTLGSQGNLTAGILFYAWQVLALLLLALACVIFPLLGRFHFTLGQLLKTGVALTLCHLPSALLSALVVWVCGVGVARFFAAGLLLPAFAMLLISLPLERVFHRHLPPEA